MSPTVEVVGIHHKNKGAVLMLEAIIDQLRTEFPQVRIAVPLTFPVEQRLKRGLYASSPREVWRYDLSFVADRVPTSLLNSFGFVAPRDIDVLLDASGFAYGDFWGPFKLHRRLLAPLKTWKRENKVAIVLPQALGPFKNLGMGPPFAKAVGLADLVFVRDRKSLDYLNAVASARNNVRLAPDFTNLLHVGLPDRLNHLRGKAFVIPNLKVFGSNSGPQREPYFDFLTLAMKTLVSSGREPAFLIHESDDDLAIAEKINARLPSRAPIVNEQSAITTKAIISQAELLVSSRFHGLVSALSAGVPALACGWSHKYSELMQDYGCQEFAINIADREQWLPSLRNLIAAANNGAFRAKLTSAADRERDRTRAMWGEVFALIRKRTKYEPSGGLK